MGMEPEPEFSPIPPPKAKTSVAAIISLICGLVVCIPFVTGLVAIITGWIGIKKTRDPLVTGKGLAITGLILGVLSLGGWTIGTALTVTSGYYIYQQGEIGRKTAEDFTRNVSEGKIDAAVALSVEGIDRASLDALNEKMKPWGAFQKLDLTKIDIKDLNGKFEYLIGGTATFANEPKAYTMSLSKVGEAYKVLKFDFP